MHFAVIGLDHPHILDITAGLLDAGATCAGYDPQTTDLRVFEAFRTRFPQVDIVNRERLLDDPRVSLIASATVPRERAGLAVASMQHGKDVLVDKPGVTTFEQLAAVEAAVAETGRIFSVCFSERFLRPSTDVALRMVRDGDIGRVVQTIGLGPHRLNRAIRPAWFWDRTYYGGILVDIASHQIDQFLAFTGARAPRVVHSSVGRFATRDEFDDFGEVLLASESASGYLRVDWFTPEGLPTWGDVRLTVLGTQGTIELRKNVDIAGRDGTDHLFIVDRNGVRHVDCSAEPVTFFRALCEDVETRGATAMPQAHVFAVCRLALEAQERAVRVPERT